MSDPELAQRLQQVPTPNARGILADLGVREVLISGLVPVVAPAGPIAGPARTVRYLPARGDLPRTPRGAPNRELFDTIGAGEIMVCDGLGRADAAVMGDMMAARAAVRGAAGVIADGVVRDVDELVQVGLPTFARGTHTDPWPGKLMPWEIDVPIHCGGALVQPGDWILADLSAVIVVPGAHVATVIERDEAIRNEEAFCQALIGAGFAIDDAYPLPEHMRDAYAVWQRDGTVPTP